MKEYIINRVHELYWDGDINCARTTLELRPTGFSESDPPHMCEKLTCNGIEFAYQYILEITEQKNVTGLQE